MTTVGNLIDALRKANEIENPQEAYENGDLDFLDDVMKELGECAETAQNILLSSIPEERLVELMLIVQKAVVARVAVTGHTNILLCELSGELQAYTYTVVLSTIGALIKDEIL